MRDMSNKRKIPFGIFLFALYQLFHSLALILGGINALFAVSAVPPVANIELEVNREIIILFQLISIIIGIWGLSLAFRLFKLNDKARRRLILYSKILLAFSLILFLLGIVPVILITIISVIALLYLKSKKVMRAFGIADTEMPQSNPSQRY